MWFRFHLNSRKAGLLGLVAALLCGAPSATVAAPVAGKLAPKTLEPVSPSRVMVPPASALVTAWPRVSPCANVRLIDVAGYRAGTLFWSSVSGAKQLAFGQELTQEAQTLLPRLPWGALERFWAMPGPTPDAIYLDCKARDDGSAEHSIEWNLNESKDRFELTARYALPAMPRGWRVRRWIERPANHLSEAEKPAPFLAQMGWARKQRDDPSGPSVRFTRDILADLRDVIAFGCAGQRCSSVMQSFSLSALKATRDPKPSYERLDQETGEVQPFGHKYEWRVSTEAARTEVGCYDTSSDQILCELTLTTSARQSLHYDAWYSKLELIAPAGSIEFDAIAGGGKRVTISGAALALVGQ